MHSFTDGFATGFQPDVSFAIASYNCVAYLNAAVDSALAQTGVMVEVIIVDDGSTDGSDQVAAALAKSDPRIRFLRTPQNGGPAAARNMALRAMRGRWFAVLDSDDLITPDRTRRLIDVAANFSADMIADDLVVFGEGLTDVRFLGRSWPECAWLRLDRFLADSAIFGRAPNPGFLKPMISAALLTRTGIVYDERLRIAEDDDLVVRLLLADAHYLLLPEPLYRYRKHDASISHRLSVDHVNRMAAAGERLRALLLAKGKAAIPAFRRRDRALANAVAFTHAIAALKERNLMAALRHVTRQPGSLALFAMPIRAKLTRMVGS